MIYDAVVIGAGPAGACFARTIAAGGGKVALVDRAKFPRDKLCGGLLTEKTLELLDSVYLDCLLSGVEIRNVHVFYKKELTVSLHMLSRAKTLRRYTLDTALALEAKRQGAHLYLGSPVQTIDFEKNEAILKDGQVLRYEHLVGADGALSSVRKLLGLPRNQMGFCVEAHIPWGQIKETGRLRESGIEIYYGTMDIGYGWVFPAQDSVVVGVGNLSEGLSEKATVASFYSFIDKVAYPSNIRPRGAYLPSGQSVVLGVPNRENIYLLGDAAGLIDPFTGEGIYYAFQSAQIAAETVLSGESTYSGYRQRMGKIISSIAENCQIRNELYTPAILTNAIASMRETSQYSEELIDQTIVRYSKSYRDAYEEFKSYAR